MPRFCPTVSNLVELGLVFLVELPHAVPRGDHLQRMLYDLVSTHTHTYMCREIYGQIVDIVVREESAHGDNRFQMVDAQGDQSAPLPQHSSSASVRAFGVALALDSHLISSWS
jgi:hypothetical protein